MEIKAEIVNDIITHCRSDQSKESCGLIFGNNIINSIIKGKNLSKYNHAYTIDPETTIHVFDKDFKGIYHSHINIPAIPSTIDYDKANMPGKFYLIYSLKYDQLIAYKWDGKTFLKEPIQIE